MSLDPLRWGDNLVRNLAAWVACHPDFVRLLGRNAGYVDDPFRGESAKAQCRHAVIAVQHA